MLVCLVLASGQARAAGSLFVGDWQGKDIDKDLAGTLSDLLASQMAEKTPLSVSSQSQVAAVLHNQAASQAAGNDVDAAEIAKRMKADYLVSGSVGRVGRVFVVTLALSALQPDADQTIAGKKNHWSLVAEGEVENLIAAVDRAADAVAEVVSPGYHPAARAPAPSAPAKQVSAGDSAPAVDATKTSGGHFPFPPPPPGLPPPPPWLLHLPPLPPPPQVSLPSPKMILSVLTPDFSKLPEWKGLATKEMLKSELDSLGANLKKRLQK